MTVQKCLSKTNSRRKKIIFYIYKKTTEYDMKKFIKETLFGYNEICNMDQIFYMFKRIWEIKIWIKSRKCLKLKKTFLAQAVIKLFNCFIYDIILVINKRDFLILQFSYFFSWICKTKRKWTKIKILIKSKLKFLYKFGNQKKNFGLKNFLYHR